jgi:DNA-directed RNA polymerase subunit RPC12/RpoP
MSDPIHPEGIYECNGCGRIYCEYINGCLSEHLPPRSVRLVVPELPDSPSRLPEKGEPARCPECGSERRGAPSCGCGWHDGSPT